MLTADEIRMLLEELTWKTMFEGVATRVRLQEREMGYSKDPQIGILQTKLSIMLEARIRYESDDDEGATAQGHDPG